LVKKRKIENLQRFIILNKYYKTILKLSVTFHRALSIVTKNCLKKKNKVHENCESKSPTNVISYNNNHYITV